jgi:hypothetical protein
MSAEHPYEKNHIQIQLPDDVANGMYINLVLVNHNENEFVLDAVFVQPQQPKATVRARLITSPKHTKNLLNALEDNIRKYEARFGKIDTGTGDPNNPLLQ